MFSVNHRFTWFVWLTMAVCSVSACSALTPDDPAATLRAEREGYVAEATLIADSAVMHQTYVIETVAAAETRITDIDARNALLLATLRAALPPTQQIISDSGIVTPGQVATPAPAGSFAAAPNATLEVGGASSVGNTMFVDVATASTVRDSDGCAANVQTTFPADISRIYVTARALNITAGTVMRVEWTYEGTSAFSESFTVDQDDSDFCLWFYIEPTEVVLSPGAWFVQLYANDQAVEPVVSFSVGSSDIMNDG